MQRVNWGPVVEPEGAELRRDTWKCVSAALRRLDITFAGGKAFDPTAAAKSLRKRAAELLEIADELSTRSTGG